MKRTTAQRFLGASGILALLGGGSCFYFFNASTFSLNWSLFGGFSGLGVLVIAAILGIIGLIGCRRDD